MPVYTFTLHDGRGGLEDGSGVTLANHQSAIRYGHDVVRELMRCREVETRAWRLDVYAQDGEHVCEIPFASVDPTLDHLTPPMREMVEGLSQRKRLLSDAVHSVSVTIQESRALVARARGKPYLASNLGKPTIR
jgi:hypothetical protein